MPDIKQGPFTTGIDNVSEDEALPLSAVREALNTDFSADGDARRRGGAVLKTAASGLHSLWSSGKAGNPAYVMQGPVLNRIRPDFSLEPLITMPSDGETGYDESENTVWLANAGGCAMIRDGEASLLGVPETAAFSADPASVGGLTAGRYLACIAFQLPGGEEGAASPARQVDVLEGGGLLLTWTVPAELPAGSTACVFVSQTNGDALYLRAIAPASMGTGYTVGAMTPGRLCGTRHMRRMRGGSLVQHWQGRLLVARGRTLLFSEPMQPGLYSPRHGFIQFAGQITMLAALPGALYVGQPDGVHVLLGNRPSELPKKRAGVAPPVPGASHKIQANLLDARLKIDGDEVAVWLSENGYVLGTSAGNIIELQARRITLRPSAAGSLAVHDRRLTTVLKD